MQVHRGRAFVRAWPAGHGDVTGTAAIVGLIECSGDVVDEAMHGITLTTVGDTVMLTATGRTMHRDEQHGWDFEDRTSDIDYVLTGRQWPRPDPATGLDGGGVMVRRTNAPAAAGRATYIVVALVSSDVPADRTMVDIEGRLDGTLVVSGARNVDNLQTNGSTLAQVLKMPLWGWDGDLWAMTSTVHVDVLRDCARLHDIREGLAEPRPGEREMLERGAAGDVMGTGRRDGRYQEFRRRWRERHGPMDGARWLGWERPRADDDVDARAEAIIREMLDEPYAAQRRWAA